MSRSYLNLFPTAIRRCDEKRSSLIQTPALPKTLKFPVPTGCTADCILIQKNDHVRRGQALTCSDGFLVPPIHASSSGTITAIDSTHITVTTDGKDEWVNPKATDKISESDQMAHIAHEAGLVGQGGAGFPLAAKLSALNATRHLMLVNAAECDPLICCDEALIIQKAASIVDSIDIIAANQRINQVCIGIEDNKHEAIDALQSALASTDNRTTTINFVAVPAHYPIGAEKTLLRLCSEIAPIAGKNLAETGVLSMNIASCDALGEVLKSGRPCTERVTTVIVPDGTSYNLRLRLGTTVDQVYDYLNQTDPLNTIGRITTGGQMMYQETSANDSIMQTSNCIAFEKNAPTAKLSQPCIRCGLCTTICPENLMPQQLHTYTINFSTRKLVEYDIDLCIECRCCDVVCPSQIPLANQFRSAKKRIEANRQNETDAALARMRYEKRLQRLATRDSTKRRKVKQAQNKGDKPASSHRALIEAALTRKNQKRRNDH